MAEKTDGPATPDELILRLIVAVRHHDLFRVVVRGFGIFEDLVEREVASLLAEPLSGLQSAPFRHKLNLAVAVGLVDKSLKPTLDRLASLRHALAHADRDPADVTVAELEALLDVLDPDRELQRGLLKDGVVLTPALAAGVVLTAAFMAVDTGGHVARGIRERERDAFRREVAAQMGMTPLLQAILSEVRTGAQGAEPA